MGEILSSRILPAAAEGAKENYTLGCTLTVPRRNKSLKIHTGDLKQSQLLQVKKYL